MKKTVFGPVGVLFLSVVSLASPLMAAELLDVKPIMAGSSVAIEVTADIPMTYTYYKVPGQARAVVDIADADPEKVEALIVVNKGAISSISVDKAMLGDMVVSRLVFNLVAESDISVSQAADRKTLMVSFGSGKPVAAPPAVAPVAPPAEQVTREPVVPVSAAVAEPKEPAVAAVAASKPLSKEEEDPLGLDDPVTVAAPAKEPAVVRAALEPVVPETTDQASPSLVAVKGIVIGATSIEIQTNGPVEKFKQLRLAKPARLSIEIPGTTSMKESSFQVKRFGVSKVRVGTTPGFVRVVLDASKTTFPGYDVVTVENGLRIDFK